MPQVLVSDPVIVSRKKIPHPPVPTQHTLACDPAGIQIRRPRSTTRMKSYSSNGMLTKFPQCFFGSFSTRKGRAGSPYGPHLLATFRLFADVAHTQHVVGGPWHFTRRVLPTLGSSRAEVTLTHSSIFGGYITFLVWVLHKPVLRFFTHIR